MRKAFLITCFVLALIVATGAWWLWHHKSDNTPDAMMHADVHISKSRFSATNNNSFDWGHIVVLIDSSHSSSKLGEPGYIVTTKSYIMKMRCLRAGQTFSCDLAKFKYKQGSHFAFIAQNSSSAIIYTVMCGDDCTWQNSFQHSAE